MQQTHAVCGELAHYGSESFKYDVQQFMWVAQFVVNTTSAT